ncbi:MAG TPA: hypothetical protein VGO50_08130 [Pyrinomonadaceae bacterium]|nr:hypothetical protein [Pyrinomonadaceae bacterium]
MKVKALLVIAAWAMASGVAHSQTYSVSQTKTFTQSDGQIKKVLLLKKQGTAAKNIILFQTMLRVNTDGSPLSYHPQDPRGNVKALNNVCNAMSIVKISTGKNLCLTSFGTAIGVFEQFREHDWVVPPGFRINWANVIPAEKKNGRDIPCIFKSGEFTGYFGSLTALKNGLTVGQRGECEVDNQINPIRIPALVLVGGTNAVKTFGARVGDLVVAFNPKTNLTVAAVIGDTGPPDNLGEGSVALNMKLKGTSAVPTKKSETFALNIEGDGVLIAIIPASKDFRKNQNVYTVENINERIAQWQTDTGFSGSAKFVEMMRSFQAKLR